MRNSNGDENINFVKELVNAFKTVVYFLLILGLIAYIVYAICPKKETKKEYKIKKLEPKKQKGNINGIPSKKLERVDKNTFKTGDGEVIRLY